MNCIRKEWNGIDCISIWIQGSNRAWLEMICVKRGSNNQQIYRKTLASTNNSQDRTSISFDYPMNRKPTSRISPMEVSTLSAHRSIINVTRGEWRSWVLTGCVGEIPCGTGKDQSVYRICSTISMGFGLHRTNKEERIDGNLWKQNSRTDKVLISPLIFVDISPRPMAGRIESVL